MNASTLPSSFQSPLASAANSSVALQYSKRHSVSVLPSSTSSGPRPLHLLDLTNSASSSSVTSPLSIGTPSSSNFYSLSPVSATSSLHSHSISTPTSRSNTPKSTRRQSSISYFPQNHDRESDARRTSSPLYTPHEVGLSRSNSSRGPGEKVLGNRASTGSTILLPSAIEREREKERPPLTLAEKHAELLHFIAQKESKCLELRSQLAIHEAELLQLKRKWERIVNRGFDRDKPSTASSTYSSQHTSSSSDLQGALMSLTSPTLALEGIKEGVQGMSRFLAAGLSMSGPGSTSADAPTKPRSASPRSGIRPTPSKFSPSPSPLSPSPLSASSTSLADLPSSTGSSSSPAARTFHRHAAQSSNSSSSTTGTTNTTRSNTTAASNPHRLSQCSSATSAEVAGDYDDENDAFVQDGDTEDEVLKRQGSPQELIVNDTGATPTVSPNPAFHTQEKQRKKLEDERNHDYDWSSMVSADAEADTDGWAEGGNDGDGDAWDAWGEGEVVEEFSIERDRTPTKKHDIKVGNGAGILKLEDPPKGLNSLNKASLSSKLGTRSMQDAMPVASRSSRSSSSLTATSVPASSIPGFGAASIAGLGALASPQVSSWVGSMGKKFGDLQKGSNALTKGQKRASVLFSDMSQTIASALISPNPAVTSLQPSSKSSPSAGLDSPPSALTSRSAASPTFASNTHRPMHSLSLSASLSHSRQKTKEAETQGISNSPTSLLDDDDDISLMTKSVSSSSMSVMTPDVRPNSRNDSRKPKGNGMAGAAPPHSGEHGSVLQKKEAAAVQEDDEWNW